MFLVSKFQFSKSLSFKSKNTLSFTSQRTFKTVLPFDPLYDPEEIVDLKASYRTIKGSKGCRILRQNDLVPGIISGGMEKNVLVQTSRFPVEKLMNSTGFLPKKYCLNFDNGDKVFVKPTENKLHHIHDYPAWITWIRLNPIKREKKIVEKPTVYKQFSNTIIFKHPIFTVKKSCKSIEAKEHSRKRRLTHIHDLLGIPKAVQTQTQSQ